MTEQSGAGNIQIVQQALGAVRAGDMEAAKEVVADDFVWHIPGTSVVGGDITGPQEWYRKLGRLLDAGLQPQVLAMLEGDTHVAALQRNTAEVGEHRLDIEVVNLFTITDGRVARLDTFFGDQPAAERFWDAVLGEG